MKLNAPPTIYIVGVLSLDRKDISFALKLHINLQTAVLQIESKSFSLLHHQCA